MKKSIFLAIAALCFQTLLFSQPLRLHVMAGVANYSGDIQQKAFTLNQAKSVISAGATFDLSNHFALRSDYSFGKLGADDKYNSDPLIRARNLNFQSYLKEFSLMGEYTLFDVSEKPLSPYVFAGVSGFSYNPYTYTSSNTKVYLRQLGTEGQGLAQYPNRKIENKVQVALPVGGGVKYALSDDIHLGLELGVRKTFTDYIDDVSTTYVDENVLLNARGATAVDLAFRGDELKTNPQSYPGDGAIRGGKAKDLYYFGQFRISFRMNWFDGNGGGGRGRKYGCPARVL